jgi:hypothetical protein
MGVLDKVKAAAGQATTKAQEGVASVQTKRKLTQAYGELDLARRRMSSWRAVSSRTRG